MLKKGFSTYTGKVAKEIVKAKQQGTGNQTVDNILRRVVEKEGRVVSYLTRSQADLVNSVVFPKKEKEE